VSENRKCEGQNKSLFYFNKMIKKQEVIDLINSHFEGTDKFLVDIKILIGNKIEIYVDAPNHIVIADCVALSRFVEGNLDREKEDYELQVSSPGATESFKVLQQYVKYIGTEVQVKTVEGNKHKGKLISANEKEFVIEETRREKKTVGKGNHTVVENITLTYNQTKETKSVLPF
jgi:ribosome maturation factor RimP